MGWNQKTFLRKDFLAVYSPALITPLSANIFPNKLVSNVPNNILRNPPFCPFASFLIVSVTPSNNNQESSRDLINLKRFCMSSFEIIKVVL